MHAFLVSTALVCFTDVKTEVVRKMRQFAQDHTWLKFQVPTVFLPSLEGSCRKAHRVGVLSSA